MEGKRVNGRKGKRLKGEKGERKGSEGNGGKKSWQKGNKVIHKNEGNSVVRLTLSPFRGKRKGCSTGKRRLALRRGEAKKKKG